MVESDPVLQWRLGRRLERLWRLRTMLSDPAAVRQAQHELADIQRHRRQEEETLSQDPAKVVDIRPAQQLTIPAQRTAAQRQHCPPQVPSLDVEMAPLAVDDARRAARLALELGDFTQAWTCTEAWLEEKPSDAEGWWIRAWALCGQGKLDEAVVEAVFASGLEPTHPTYAFDAGWLAHLNGTWIEAFSCYERTLTLCPQNPVYRASLALLHIEREEQSEAERILRECPLELTDHDSLRFVRGIAFTQTLERIPARATGIKFTVRSLEDFAAIRQALAERQPSEHGLPEQEAYLETIGPYLAHMSGRAWLPSRRDPGDLSLPDGFDGGDSCLATVAMWIGWVLLITLVCWVPEVFFLGLSAGLVMMGASGAVQSWPVVAALDIAAGAILGCFIWYNFVPRWKRPKMSKNLWHPFCPV